MRWVSFHPGCPPTFLDCRLSLPNLSNKLISLYAWRCVSQAPHLPSFSSYQCSKPSSLSWWNQPGHWHRSGADQTGWQLEIAGILLLYSSSCPCICSSVVRILQALPSCLWGDFQLLVLSQIMPSSSLSFHPSKPMGAHYPQRKEEIEKDLQMMQA